MEVDDERGMMTTFYSVNQEKETDEVRLKVVQPRTELDKVKLVIDLVGAKEEAIHGFINNKTVYVDSETKLSTSSAHFTFLQSAINHFVSVGDFSDLNLVVGTRQDRRELTLNILVAGLALPCLQSVSHLISQSDVIILPDHNIDMVTNKVNFILGNIPQINNENPPIINTNVVPVSSNFTVSNLSGKCDKDVAKVVEVTENVIDIHMDPASEKGVIKVIGIDSHVVDDDNNIGYEVMNSDKKITSSELGCRNGCTTFLDQEHLATHVELCSVRTSKFSCQICRETFPNMYMLVTHEVESHTDIKTDSDHNATRFDSPVECYKCKTMMTLSSELVGHNCSQTKYSPTRCTDCLKILANKTQMISHTCTIQQSDDIYDPDDDKTCFSCGKEFTTIRKTIIHEIEDCNNITRQEHPTFGLEIYYCQLCGLHFVIKNKFKLHMEEHHLATVSGGSQENKNYKLNDRSNDESMEFEEVVEPIDSKERRDFLKAVNQLQELGEFSNKCSHCDKILSSHKACIEHEVNVHGDLSNAEQVFRCEFCPKIFVSRSVRDNHATSHTDERKFQCHLCALTFKTTGNLTAHLASLHEPEDNGGLVKKFQCKFCPKTFRFPAQIQQHERVHTKEKPFNCSQCGKGFSVKCNLKAHMETHKSVEDRIFKCSECDHRATSLPLLRLHMNSHTGERPFVCDLCGESYKRPSNLRRHKKTMCRLGTEEAVVEEMYERTLVVHEGEEGDIIIQTEIEDSSILYNVEPEESGLVVESMGEVQSTPNELLTEEEVVEDDGIKYETHLVTM